ncbi:MAG: Xaa-Pro peptidase family protein [Actinobacteria bacterium]|nr:Xaa-Pro peptidase family protein [Actinomycetota bacterium]
MNSISKEEIKQRVEKVKAKMEEAGLKALIIYASGNRNMYSNVLYLSNYYMFDPYGQALLILLIEGQMHLIMNIEWDVNRAKLTSVADDVISTSNLSDAAAKIIQSYSIKQDELGLVGESYMPYNLYQKLTETLHPKHIISVTEMIEEFRLIKSPSEITLLRDAARLMDLGIGTAVENLQPGRTELEVLASAINAMLIGGADEIAFTPQVSFGENTYVCMTPASKNRLKENDMAMFDMGIIYGYYAGDESRTVLIGKANNKLKRIYDLVNKAQMAALKAVRPGVIAEDIDKIARGIIEEGGYGQYFNHYTGHGIGLSLHEDPFIEQHNYLVLKPGMVFSVEPGVYLPNVGGVRTEDIVLVTEDGNEVLTKFERYLVFP